MPKELLSKENLWTAIKGLVLLILGYGLSLINSIDQKCDANRESLIRVETKMEIISTELTRLRDVPPVPDIQF